jgi:V8-like Glu-specific endopeptidase
MGKATKPRSRARTAQQTEPPPEAPELEAAYEEEMEPGEAGGAGEFETSEEWEGGPEAPTAMATATEVEEREELAEHAEVSSAEPGQAEAGEFEPSEFGEEGIEAEPAVAEIDEAIEPVAEFDPEVLEATRETVIEANGATQLLDAWYAEFGDPAMGVVLRDPRVMESIAEVVIGKDDRVRIRNTRAYPWRCICQLLITARDGSRWTGTGWLVGRRTLMTAGHCVYMHTRGGWARSIEVIPGRDAGNRPFGSRVGTQFFSVRGWTRSRKRAYDYGAILLPRNTNYGGQLGYFGFANYSFFTLMGMKVNLSGYPGDKPTGTQWWHCRRIKLVTPRTLVYNIDTAGGQSGSPVWRKKGNQRYAVGIHTNGSSSGNSATRITKAVYKNIKRWKQLGI